jgi:hypothetical protein
MLEAPRAIAFQIVFGRDLDLVPIEPVVLVEARVVRGDCWSEVLVILAWPKYLLPP